MEHIKGKILSGEYPPGFRLPSVRDMAQAEAVNPNTMLRTLAELEREGLVTTQRTTGKNICEDTERIERLRAGTAAELTGEYLARMRALGFEDDKIDTFIKGIRGGDTDAD